MWYDFFTPALPDFDTLEITIVCGAGFDSL